MGRYDSSAIGSPWGDAPRPVAAFSRNAAFLNVVSNCLVGFEAELQFSGGSQSTAELIRSMTARAPVLLVLDSDSLGGKLAVLLVEARAVAPGIVSLLVGVPDDHGVLVRSLSFGLRGVIPPDRLATDLTQAARTVLTGQLWFSRGLMTALLADRMQAPTEAPTDRWRNLAALTDRELAVLHEVLQGRANKEIARTLAISEQTVKIHLQNIFHKLRVHRRIDLMLLHNAAQD